MKINGKCQNVNCQDERVYSRYLTTVIKPVYLRFSKREVYLHCAKKKSHFIQPYLGDLGHNCLRLIRITLGRVK